MLIKAGVDISRLNREIRRGMGKVDQLYTRHEREFIITSTYEGNHSAGSLHYGDDAFDCRYPFGEKDNTVLSEIEDLLGTDFDVVLKADHLHVEYDPPKH